MWLENKSPNNQHNALALVFFLLVKQKLLDCFNAQGPLHARDLQVLRTMPHPLPYMAIQLSSLSLSSLPDGQAIAPQPQSFPYQALEDVSTSF